MVAEGLAIHCCTFRVPKRDHRLDECEDFAAADPAHGRFAVADGAAESAESGRWAQLLVDTFVHARPEKPWPEWLPPLQRQWADAVRRPSSAEPLPWFLEGRYRDGAYATFLGLLMDESRWAALAVGDSCLFLVRGDHLEVTFPLERSAEFDNSPWLVSSRAGLDQAPLQHTRYLAGNCRPGDRLFLMTDALSRWFLTEAEAGQRPWRSLEELYGQSNDAFADWVGRRRADRHLRNDDTTLVSIRL